MDFEGVDREALMRIFSEEAEEGLVRMEQALVALGEQPDDSEALQTVFRIAHTLKGSASCLGFAHLAEVTHGLEGVLERFRSAMWRSAEMSSTRFSNPWMSSARWWRRRC